MRFNIKAVLADPQKRRALFIRAIQSAQNAEGIPTTAEQAAAAYDKVQQERRERSMAPKVPVEAPLAGLPRNINGKTLAWATPVWTPGLCASCGKGVEDSVVLCGACALVLADAAGPQVQTEDAKRFSNRVEWLRKRGRKG